MPVDTQEREDGVIVGEGDDARLLRVERHADRVRFTAGKCDVPLLPHANRQSYQEAFRGVSHFEANLALGRRYKVEVICLAISHLNLGRPLGRLILR